MPEAPPSPSASHERQEAGLPADKLPQVFIDFKRLCQSGNAAPLTSFPLSNADFARLHNKIQANFRRFDYNPQLECISFCIPSLLYDFFIRLFGPAVLDAVREDMSDMMAKAEWSTELRKSRKNRTPKRITKRRYVESPEDKMGTDDEKRYSQEADEANGKEDRDDGAYKPPKNFGNMTFEPRKKRAQGAGQGD
ncbi:hypothetical protein ACKAV7_004179 [Fusarium commune]|nr:hypothetical protein QWA68_016313 [Fusarium oxysporum]